MASSSHHRCPPIYGIHARLGFLPDSDSAHRRTPPRPRFLSPLSSQTRILPTAGLLPDPDSSYICSFLRSSTPPSNEDERLRSSTLQADEKTSELLSIAAARKKNLTMGKNGNDGDVVRREQLVWTPQMDEVFIQAMLTQQYEGNRIDGSFTSTAYANMLIGLRETLNKDFTKAHLKNRLKTLKDHFAQCYDLFQGVGLSGFSWNSETKLFEAEEEVWEALIAAKPDAAKWKTKQIFNYDELQELFAKDRTTGGAAETAKEKRKRIASTTSKNVQTIDEVDHLLSTNEVILENFSNNEEGIPMPAMPAPQERHQNATTSKGKKRKNDDGDLVTSKILSSMEIVAEAIRDGNASVREGNAILERSLQRKYSEEEIYNELELMGLEPAILSKAYLFLVKHPDNARAMFDCPLPMRRRILEDMMSQNAP